MDGLVEEPSIKGKTYVFQGLETSRSAQVRVRVRHACGIGIFDIGSGWAEMSMRLRGSGCVASRRRNEIAPFNDERPTHLGSTTRERSPVKLASQPPDREPLHILDNLTRLDDRIVECLRANDIRLLRTSWLQGPSIDRMARRQDLERRYGDAPFLSPEESEAVLRRGGRGIAALTYGWLAPGDPDPLGQRLGALRAAFVQLPYLEGVFWDYASLPQVRSILLPLASRAILLTIGLRLHAAPTRQRRGRRVPPRPQSHGRRIHLGRGHNGAANPRDPTQA